ncbi:Metalloendoproteinase 1 [Morella rubra]|uniref:Metalloendoproteinase 1 n=2 Tax=Morella rubra TaxID=262757 RepID=A0A6A1WLL1_9ROSI|nr:Metalloendoproteinase 1 [Morella rubra]KAB1226152.1 Metalloendoproteinase 1 [Morella rubra]
MVMIYSKAISLFSSTLLPLVLLPLLSCATSPETHNQKKLAFECSKNLRGYRHGKKIKDIHDLKKYLEHFGFLNYGCLNTHTNDNDFDEFLESAVKTYQHNYHLNVSGTLDTQTVSKMTMLRCGVADIINGTNWMHYGKKRHDYRHGLLHTVSHYSFFKDSPKWPASQYHLTYGVLQSTPVEAIDPVARAFKTWAAYSQFTFSQAETLADAKIKIRSERMDHRDGNPFDGAHGILALAFSPTNGRFRYNVDEQWSVGAKPCVVELETVALHEIGHHLGLEHNSIKEAIMYPLIDDGATKGLHANDI